MSMKTPDERVGRAFPGHGGDGHRCTPFCEHYVAPNVVRTELYECVIDEAENTVSITTEHGPDAARRFAEFEATKTSVRISLIFNLEEHTNSKVYLFRIRAGGCMEDSDVETSGKADRYQDLVLKPGEQVGCPHSRKGSPKTCSLCIAIKEKQELIALIKAGKL